MPKPSIIGYTALSFFHAETGCPGSSTASVQSLEEESTSLWMKALNDLFSSASG